MIQLVKLKDQILQFVGRYEIYVMAAFRFVVGFVAFRMIVTNLDYMEALSGNPIPVLLALLCCFLPSGVMLFCAAMLILLELLSLSTLIFATVAMVFLIMFCAYLRFTSRKGMYAMLTPVMSMFGISYTMPVASGLLGEPYAVISVICGEVTYFILHYLSENAALFLSEEVDTSTLLTLVVTDILLDWEMYLYLIAFAAAAVVTYCIRKLQVRQSFLIAIAVGIVTQIAVIGSGEVMLGNQAALSQILLGCVVSFGILLVISFFTHTVDYKRIENVQFEDDDYYYYVKAVPKSFLPQQKKTQATTSRPVSTRSTKTSAGRPSSAEGGAANAARRAGSNPSSAAAREKSRRRNGVEHAHATKQTDAAAAQLAAEAAEKAAAAAAAERAAAAAVAERAAAAAQAISEAAGQTASGVDPMKETKEP